MSEREPVEIVKIAAPIFLAEAAVVGALFIGATVIVRDHTVWGMIVGMLR